MDYIENAVIFYHEPYSSSASEMVAELLQYLGDGEKEVEAVFAEALLAGLVLDTKNFAVKTGVKTFEAAGYLRSLGADTVEVKRLFSSTMEDFQNRTAIVTGAMSTRAAPSPNPPTTSPTSGWCRPRRRTSCWRSPTCGPPSSSSPRAAR